MQYDAIIIGAGIAGLTASIYLRRAGKTALVIEKESFGGQITLSPEVENFPSISTISGVELADRLVAQATALGVEFEIDAVTSVSKSDDAFTVKTEYGEFTSKAAIIATGLKHRRLDIDGASKFESGGVSYCAVCDGAFYRGKDVAVIGGGNTALTEAIYLASIANTVYLVHRRGSYRAESAVVDRMAALNNIVQVKDSVPVAIHGSTGVETLTVRNVRDGRLCDLPVNGIFVALGHVPVNGIFEELTQLDEHGFIIADERCSTDTAGLFVAGDCRTKSVRQLTTAAADGAVAGIAAAEYIDLHR